MSESIGCSLIAGVTFIVNGGHHELHLLEIIVAVGVGLSSLDNLEVRWLFGRFAIIRILSKIIQFFIVQYATLWLWIQFGNVVYNISGKAATQWKGNNNIDIEDIEDVLNIVAGLIASMAIIITGFTQRINAGVMLVLALNEQLLQYLRQW